MDCCIIIFKQKKMFYKYENGEWFIGARIYFPDGTILSLENKIEKDGWMWHDEPPREYLEWFQKIY